MLRRSEELGLRCVLRLSRQFVPPLRYMFQSSSYIRHVVAVGQGGSHGPEQEEIGSL